MLIETPWKGTVLPICYIINHCIWIDGQLGWVFTCSFSKMLQITKKINWFCQQNTQNFCKFNRILFKWNFNHFFGSSLEEALHFLSFCSISIKLPFAKIILVVSLYLIIIIFLYEPLFILPLSKNIGTLYLLGVYSSQTLIHA